VKAILEYTAQVYDGYDALTQGAGFLNTKGAVDLARFFRTAQPGQEYPHPPQWSKTLLWGNHRISQGVIKPNAPAWQLNIVWGTDKSLTGANIVWGTFCNLKCEHVTWNSSDSEDNIVWGTASAREDNIVWGTFARLSEDNIVWGTARTEDNIVWGTARASEDNIVWGTDCGGANCANVIWGAAANSEDNIVWGTARSEDNIVWGTARTEDNIVWGTASAGEDNVTWGTSGEDSTLFDAPNAVAVSLDSLVSNDMFGTVVLDPVAQIVTTTTTLLSGLLGVR
jgi:hypothetical protein